MNALISASGLYDGIPNADYHGQLTPTPSLSASGAIEIMRSCPLKFWHGSYLNPDRVETTSNEMDVGTAAHCAVLERERFWDRVVSVDKPNWQTNAAKNARVEAEAAGKVALLGKSVDKVMGMVEAVMAHPIAGAALREGQAERTAVWEDARRGIWLKARPDWLANGGDDVLDYKTVVSAHPRAFTGHVFNMGYHQQAPFYLDVMRLARGKDAKAFWFIAQERDPPFLVTVFHVTGELLEWGEKLNRKAAYVFARCVAKNDWPAYRTVEYPENDIAVPLGLPAYAAYQLADREMDGEFGLTKPKPGAMNPVLSRRAMEMQAPLDVEEETA